MDASKVSEVLPILQAILTMFNIVIISYGFYKFLSKPHNSLESRIAVLEAKEKEHEQERKQDDEKFGEQAQTNEVIQRSMLALIEFEIQFCTAEGKGISKELERARDELHSYLARK